MHPVALIVLYAALAVTPLVLAALSGARESAALHELAVGAGLVGYAMLLMQFISSGRYEGLSGRVGIDRTMRFHQLSARALTLLILAHPLLLVFPRSVGGMSDSAHMLWRIVLSAPMRTGALALGLTVVLVAMGIWRHRLPLKYEFWRGSHALGATVIAVAGAHHIFTLGTYSAQPWLHGFWWLMLTVALGALVYVYVIKPWVLAHRAYRVVSVNHAADGVNELVLEPAKSRSISFAAGQFAWLNFRRWPLPVTDNPFSMSSSPAELPRVRFLIRSRGDTTGRLESLEAGAPVYLDAPHGNFRLDGRSAEAICLIAGGIGIAPVIGILRDLAARRDSRPVALLYGARTPGQLVHADEIAELRQSLDLSIEFFVDVPSPGWSGQKGAINPAAVRAALRAPPRQCTCLVCGPAPMMPQVERMLVAAGVPAKNVVYERFEYD